MVQILNAPDLKERFAARGVELVASSPEEFTAFLKSEKEKWSKVIRDAGIHADDRLG